MTSTSATSSSPALFACTASPQPGLRTTTTVSQLAATSTSTCPTPTVSTITSGHPAASKTLRPSGTAAARPPRCPRVAIERMIDHRVEGVVLHPDSVPEDGPTRERRGRVDCEHGDGVTGFLQRSRRCRRRERRLAEPGCACEPDRVGGARRGRSASARSHGPGSALLGDRQQAGEGRDRHRSPPPAELEQLAGWAAREIARVALTATCDRGSCRHRAPASARRSPRSRGRCARLRSLRSRRRRRGRPARKRLRRGCPEP